MAQSRRASSHLFYAHELWATDTSWGPTKALLTPLIILWLNLWCCALICFVLWFSHLPLAALSHTNPTVHLSLYYAEFLHIQASWKNSTGQKWNQYASLLLMLTLTGSQQCSAALLLLFSEESFHLGLICLFQTSSRGHPDGAEPSGELWTSRSSADQTSDPHHPPLCWQCPGRLAHTAEEPTGHGRVGGECSTLCPVCLCVM